MTSQNQLQAARVLLGLSQSELGEMIGKSAKTIQRAENGSPNVPALTIDSIRSALEEAGIEFIPENGGGAGVRLKSNLG